jgi:hypothetical protein
VPLTATGCSMMSVTALLDPLSLDPFSTVSPELT